MTDIAEVRTALLADSITALEHTIGLIEDAHALKIDGWQPGYDDTELVPDGSYKLSDAREVLTRLRAAQAEGERRRARGGEVNAASSLEHSGKTQRVGHHHVTAAGDD
jgi:hypothetical protein